MIDTEYSVWIQVTKAILVHTVQELKYPKTTHFWKLKLLSVKAAQRAVLSPRNESTEETLQQHITKRKFVIFFSDFLIQINSVEPCCI